MLAVSLTARVQDPLESRPELSIQRCVVRRTGWHEAVIGSGYSPDRQVFVSDHELRKGNLLRKRWNALVRGA